MEPLLWKAELVSSEAAGMGARVAHKEWKPEGGRGGNSLWLSCSFRLEMSGIVVVHAFWDSKKEEVKSWPSWAVRPWTTQHTSLNSSFLSRLWGLCRMYCKGISRHGNDLYKAQCMGNKLSFMQVFITKSAIIVCLLHASTDSSGWHMLVSKTKDLPLWSLHSMW